MEKHYFTDFSAFLESCGELNYHEIFDLSQAVSGDGCSLIIFKRTEDDGKIFIEYPITGSVLELTPRAAAYFPHWMEQHKMNNLDADTWYGFRCAIERLKDESDNDNTGDN